MNKDRRAELDRAWGLLDEAKTIIEQCRDEEQDYYDNMPEGFQQGEKGEAAEAAVGYMDDAISEIESACDSIENAKE